MLGTSSTPTANPSRPRSLLDPPEATLLRSMLYRSDPEAERAAVATATPAQRERISDVRTLLSDPVRSEFESALDFDGPTHGSAEHHHRTVAEVLALATAASIDVRVIKGIVMSGLEPWRTRGRRLADVDVLVPRHQAAQLVDRLREAGYRPIYLDRPMSVLERCERSIDLTRGVQAVDVHWHLDELLVFDRANDPFTRQAATVVLGPAPGIEVPAIPHPYLLLHAAARLGRRQQLSRLRGLVDAHAVIQDRPSALPEAVELCPTPLMRARLAALVAELRAIDPGLTAEVPGAERLSRIERFHEGLAGPHCRVAHWSTDWAAKFLALCQAGEYRLGVRDAARYVAARKWGRGAG